MTREDVIRIALEVGFYDGEVDKCQLMLERFAYLVAQQEREACAKIAGSSIRSPCNLQAGLPMSSQITLIA